MAWISSAAPQGRDKRVVGVELLQATRGEISVSLTLARLPLRRPEPRLSGIDHLVRSEQDALGGDLGIQEIAHFEARRGTNLLGKGQLTFGPQCGPRHTRNSILIPTDG